MKFAFNAAEKACAPAALLCRVLKVSRSGFYAREARGPSSRKADDEKLSVRIAAIHGASGKSYGSPRVKAELEAEGVAVSRKRVARPMAELDLESVRKRPYPTSSPLDPRVPQSDRFRDQVP